MMLLITEEYDYYDLMVGSESISIPTARDLRDTLLSAAVGTPISSDTSHFDLSRSDNSSEPSHIETSSIVECSCAKTENDFKLPEKVVTVADTTLPGSNSPRS